MRGSASTANVDRGARDDRNGGGNGGVTDLFSRSLLGHLDGPIKLAVYKAFLLSGDNVRGQGFHKRCFRSRSSQLAQFTSLLHERHISILPARVPCISLHSSLEVLISFPVLVPHESSTLEHPPGLAWGSIPQMDFRSTLTAHSPSTWHLRMY